MTEAPAWADEGHAVAGKALPEVLGRAQHAHDANQARQPGLRRAEAEGSEEPEREPCNEAQ